MTEQSTQIAQDDQDLFPKTLDQLHVVIGEKINEILQIPANASVLAQLVLGVALKALEENAEIKHRQQTRPIVAKTYYQGALRATVTAPSADENEDVLLGVTLEEKDAEGAWTAPTWLTNEGHAALSKLVLSTTAQPGDVYYITTNQAIEAAFEQATDVVAGSSTLQ